MSQDGTFQFISIRLHGPTTFKPPQPFQAGVHGPGAIGTSLSYPMPSTIAGLLANLAYRAQLCREDELKQLKITLGYEDQLYCIEKLFGENTRIYTGLLSHKNELYAYINSSGHPRIDCLTRAALCLIEDVTDKFSCYNKLLRDCPKIRTLRMRRTGISIDSSSKSVDENMIYSIEQITYEPKANITAILKTKEQKEINTITKIGSKTGIAAVKTHPSNNIRTEFLPPGEYLAILISPAQITNPQHNPYDSGAVLLTSHHARETLAQQLIRLAGLSGRGTIHYIPKGEHEHAVTTPGWSIPRNRPRPPALIIPPGTILTLTLNKQTQAIKLQHNTYITALGENTNTGWGTTLVIK